MTDNGTAAPTVDESAQLSYGIAGGGGSRAGAVAGGDGGGGGARGTTSGNDGDDAQPGASATSGAGSPEGLPGLRGYACGVFNYTALQCSA